MVNVQLRLSKVTYFTPPVLNEYSCIVLNGSMGKL